MRHSFLLTAVLLFLLALVSTGDAALFYVASDGDDSRTSAQAQNIATPWKTPTKAGAAVLNGDTILLRRGDVFFGSLRVCFSNMFALKSGTR